MNRQKVSFLIITVVACTLCVNTAKSQTVDSNKFAFSLGGEYGAVTSFERASHNTALGFTGQIQYGAANGIAITLTAGFYALQSKTVTSYYIPYIVTPTFNNTIQTQTANFDIFPVTLGFKGFILKHFYIAGDAGIALNKANDSGSDTGSDKFILSPGLGYATKVWEMGIRYQMFLGESGIIYDNQSVGGHSQSYNYGILGLHFSFNPAALLTAANRPN